MSGVHLNNALVQNRMSTCFEVFVAPDTITIYNKFMAEKSRPYIVIKSLKDDNEFAYLFSLIQNEDLKKCVLLILKYIIELETR